MNLLLAIAGRAVLEEHNAHMGLVDPRKTREKEAVYPHARNMAPKVRSFVDFLAGSFGPRPYWDEAASAP